ncbi:hypothetical protein CC80DRAFT_202016 [Byssothecium circinans]|uniref:Uncharacterized protein n=1 Tax=Byssothecium circinans TaxID=147558 RepID=A0A6A5UE55_9PLEO|nr:hypothetical protein CC80DRAFT_202016 [Byssothecium circinans]
MAPKEKTPVNPTSYRKTIMLCGVMTLMFVNYLLDSQPHHVAYREAQLAQETQQTQGFVEELSDDDPLERSDHEPSKSHSECPDRSRDSTPSRQCQYHRPHFPTRQEPKTKWPYPKHRDRFYDVEMRTLQSEYERRARDRGPVGRKEANDAWVRMRAASTRPSARMGWDGNGYAKRRRVRWGDIEVFTMMDELACGRGRHDGTGALINHHI